MYTLDLDLYLKGYSIEEFSCVNIPTAAAAGYYNYDNYFYYGFLTAIQYNWNGISYKDNYFKSINVVKDIGKVLEQLDLKLKKNYPASKEDFMKFIISSLRENKPVIMCVKYKALFYNKYYQNSNGNDLHFMVLSQYNDKTQVIRMHDSSFLRGVNVINSTSDILFPLSFKEDMIWDIWKLTNEETEDNRRQIYDGIYALEQIDSDKKVTEVDLLQYAISQYEGHNDTFKEFLVSASDEEYGINIQKNFEYLKKRFVGCINGMFRTIRYWHEKRNISISQDVLEEYSKKRNEIFTMIYKTNLKGKILSQDKIDLYLQTIDEQNEKLISYLKELIQTLGEDEEVNIKIELGQYFSNQAIALTPEKNSSADISGNGIYFIMPDILEKSKTSQENSTYYFPYDLVGVEADNISCAGETIPVPEGKYKKIKILACSEYGSYKEHLQYGYKDEKVYTVDFAVSDFYMSPIYCETIYCSGDSYQTIDGRLEKLEFKSRIFEYQLNIENTIIDHITLPNRKNIHIFAITLVQE